MSKKSSQTKEHLVKEIKYLLYKPKNYEEDNPNPLLIFLHGAGERGDDLELVKKHGPPKLIEEGIELPLIVASPQMAMEEWWSPSTIVWLLADIKKRLNVDPDRVYLTGLSMGGYGTWETAIKYPNLFAAIVHICGRGDRHWLRGSSTYRHGYSTAQRTQWSLLDILRRCLKPWIHMGM